MKYGSYAIGTNDKGGEKRGGKEEKNVQRLLRMLIPLQFISTSSVVRRDLRLVIKVDTTQLPKPKFRVDLSQTFDKTV